MASALYNIYKSEVVKGNIDIENDTIKVLLVTSSYTPDIDNHTVRSNITNEVTWSGYTSGGTTVTNLAVSLDTANDRAVIDGDDVTFANVDGTDIAARAILYKSTGNPATDTLIGYWEPTTPRAAGGGDFVIQWNVGGLFRAN